MVGAGGDGRRWRRWWRRLDGGLGVAVAGQALHVQVVRRQLAARLRVLHAGRVRVALGQRRLLAQRLRQRRVGQRAARVQPLPERVHHADLPNPNITLSRTLSETRGSGSLGLYAVLTRHCYATRPQICSILKIGVSCSSDAFPLALII